MSAGHILVVDDDKSVLEMLNDCLSNAGYEVSTASGGEEALMQFEQKQFDCIVCDFVMPNKDGMEVLKKIRCQDRNVGFLMITGHPSLDNAVQAMKEGASDYAAKPFHLEELMIKIEKILNVRQAKESLKKVTGLCWGVIISIPIWLILGILLGAIWKR